MLMHRDQRSDRPNSNPHQTAMQSRERRGATTERRGMPIAPEHMLSVWTAAFCTVTTMSLGTSGVEIGQGESNGNDLFREKNLQHSSTAQTRSTDGTGLSQLHSDTALFLVPCVFRASIRQF